MLTHFLVSALSLWLWATARPSSNIYLKIDENNANQRNVWQMQYEPDHEDYSRSKLIQRAADLLDERKNLNSIELDKCLNKYNSLRSKLSCVEGLMYQSILQRQGSDLKFPQIIYHSYPVKRGTNGIDPHDELLDTPRSDLDRSYHQNNFSQDYLDVNDLLRTNDKTKKSERAKSKKRFVFKIVPSKSKHDRFDYDLTGLRKFGPNDYVKSSLRTRYENSDSSDNDDDSSPEMRDVKKTQNRYKEPETELDRSADGLSSSDEDESRPKKQKPKLNRHGRPAVLYMQGPSRLYVVESRRRLPHFLPKRYHWDEDEIKDLKNYWFNGPRGKYSGAYKTLY